MGIRVLLVYLWAYRKVLLICLAVSHGVAAGVILGLLFGAPHVVVFMLDVLDPLTAPVKDALWNLFPDVQWIRSAAAWLGDKARRALTKVGAQKEAVARLVMFDGFFLLSCIAWTVQPLFVRWSTRKSVRWFLRHHVILRREAYERLLAQDERLLAENRNLQEEKAQLSQQLLAAQTGQPPTIPPVDPDVDKINKATQYFQELIPRK